MNAPLAAPPELLRFLAPEARALLLTLPTGAAADGHLHDALTANGLDWSLLLQLAERERATAVLRRRIEDLAIEDLPADRVDQLAALARVSDFRMGYLEDRLVLALDRLDAAGIPVVLLKGAALAATVYDGVAERPMLDADILVAEWDSVRAWDLLLEAGWTTRHNRRQAEMYALHHHLPPLEDPANTGIAIEIHTGLAPGAGATALDAAAVRTHARPGRLRGRTVQTPAPHHLVLHNAIHFAWSHALEWGGWRTFRDLHAIADGFDIDWDAVVAGARASRAATSVYWTLRLARGLTGFPAPDSVMRALRPPRPAAVLRALDRHYATALFPAASSSCPSTTLARALWSLGMAPRRSGHGASRPWNHNADWVAARDDRGPAPRLARLRHHFAHVTTWTRYVGALLGISPSHAPRQG